MKKLLFILLLTIPFIGFGQVGPRDSQFFLENIFTDFKKWEKRDNQWKNTNGLLKKIETYSIKNRPDEILLVFYTSTNENLMTIVDKNKISNLIRKNLRTKGKYSFVDDWSNKGTLNHTINNSSYDLINILNIYGSTVHFNDNFKYSKKDFLYDSDNDYDLNTLKPFPVLRSWMVLISYHIYEDKIQFSLHLRCDKGQVGCNHLGFSDIYEVGVNHSSYKENEMIFIPNDNNDEYWDWDEYHKGTKKIMSSSYYECKLNDFKDIFLE